MSGSLLCRDFVEIVTKPVLSFRKPEIGAESRVQQSIATDAIIGAIREELNTRDTLYRQEIQSLKAEISALHLQAHARTSQTSSPLIKKEFGEEKGEERSESPSRSMQSPKKENEETAIEGLARAICGAIRESVRPEERDDLRHFVARQSLASKELPSFSGDPEEWPVFFEQFRASSAECRFSQAENMARLRKALKGKAKDTVSSLLSLPGNLTQVMETLERRFGRPDFIVESLINRTKSLPSPRDGDMVGLIDFSNAVSNLVSTMELLKSEGHVQNPELRRRLVSKLPSALQLQWGEFAHKSDVDLKVFSKWLADRADAASFVATQPRSCSDARRSVHEEISSSPTTTAGTFGVATKREDVEKKLSEAETGQRVAFVKKRFLCWNCLQRGHRAFQCRAPPRCTKCPRKHHALLHEALQKEQATRASSAPVGTAGATRSQSEEANVRAYGCQATAKHRVHLMTAVAEVKGERLRAKVRVFLDLGAQTSFVSRELVKAIKPAKLRQEEIILTAFNSAPRRELMDRYALELTTTSGQSIAITALEKPKLRLEIEPVATETVESWRGRGVELSDQASVDVPEEIHVLLGADCGHQLVLGKRIVDGEAAWNTELGWMLSGPQQTSTSSPRTTVAYLSSKVESLWQLEEPVETKHEETMQPAFPLHCDEDGYTVGLLWKSTQRPEDNRKQAFATAKALARKLEAPEKRQAYDDVLVHEYQELGAVEEEPHPEEPGYYLPHHAVVREGAQTTRTRVVFNASAAARGARSLNDTLLAGPSLLPDLTRLLIRFREFYAAFQADIKKAFFMIGIRPEDRKYLRFMWLDSDGEMKVWRLRNLPFGVNCSPYILSAVLQHHISRECRNASPALKNLLSLLHDSLYVDDCLSSVESPEAAEEFRTASVTCLQKANMTLRKWRGNTMRDEQASGEKALGVRWKTETDTLTVDVELPESSEEQPTKRSLLHAVASLFDPLGLAAPVHLVGKILLQSAWKEGTAWDEPLSPRLAEEVEKWWGEMMSLAEISIPRWLGLCPADNVTLHVFGDASEKAYGCCVYVVSSGAGSRLVYSKTKVAPLAAPTLPRLELEAACLAARRVKFVRQALRVQVSRIVAWTDSLTALLWIRGEPFRWKTWVRNRVTTIQAISRALQVEWRHCPGESNPADLASRGSSAAQLQDSLWRYGPNWITEPTAWPANQTLPGSPGEEVAVHAVECASQAQEPWFKRVSSWTRLLGVARMLYRWRPSSQSAAFDEAELNHKAEMLLYRLAQAELFPEEVQALKAGQPVHRESKLLPFRPFMDEGVIRVGGRIDCTDLPYDAKHPILLADHHVTKLLLNHVHRRTLHQGVEAGLTLLRQRHWVLKGRRLLRELKRKCVTCRKMDAQPADQISAPLPEDRVTYSRPFSVCGIDYAGPLQVRVANSRAKVWIALFVCGVTRAVHLELVRSLSTDDFLLAFRRFVARRGCPAKMRSDNATVFVAGAKVHSIPWVFNPPAAPWFGGFYERLVGTIKRPLKKVLGKAFLREEELFTVLCEVEAAVNDRPLTYCGSWEDPLPLTPSTLLGRSIWLGELPELEFDTTAEQMRQRARYIKRLGDSLRNRWSNEYVLTLSSYNAGREAEVKEGDVVLIDERPTKKRQEWRLARVVRLFAGADGRQRVAEVTAGGRSVIVRPIRRLIPLEVNQG